MTAFSPTDVNTNTGTTSRSFFYAGCKRAFDVVCAFIGLLLLWPLMASIAIAIRLCSPGPALYRGPRIGLNGRTFHVLKFRTMVVNADHLGGSCTADDDVRITRIGRWLRKTKMDELPQLINVLLGQMSLVGPRPELKDFVDRYNTREREILRVKPGITDLGTLWDSDEGAVLAGESDPEQAYREKVLPHKLRLQLEYIEKASFWFDLRILLHTVTLVAKRVLRVTVSRAPSLIRHADHH